MQNTSQKVNTLADPNHNNYPTTQAVADAISALDAPYELIRSMTVTEDADVLRIDRDENDQPFRLKKLYAHLSFPAGRSNYVQIQTSALWYGNVGFAYTNLNSAVYCNAFMEILPGGLLKAESAYGTVLNSSDSLVRAVRPLVLDEPYLTNLTLAGGVYSGVTMMIYGVRA